MAQNPIDQAEWEKKQWQKRYDDMLEKLRRESKAKTQKSIAEWQSTVGEYSNKFDQAFQHYSKIVAEHQRQLGMENFSTLIQQMGPSVEAFSKMTFELEMYFLSKACLALAENFNYNTSTPLMLTAEAARNIRAFFDYHLNTEGNFSEDMKALIVPYLADVDENGVYTVNLDVPNTQLSETDRQKFVGRYQADFNASMDRFINEYRDPATPADQVYQVETLADGTRKIRDLRHAGPNPVYIDREAFRNLRTTVLQPLLEQRFQAEFQPEAPSNLSTPSA